MKPMIIKKAAKALMLGSLLLSPSAYAAEGDILFETSFNTDGDFEGWFDNADKMKEFGWNGTTIVGEEMVIGGVFAAKITQGTNNDAQVVTNVGSGSTISLEADDVGSMTVRVRQSVDDGTTWRTAGELEGFLAVVQGSVIQGGLISQVADETEAGDGWTIATFDLVAVIGKTITDVRVDPASALDSSFEIDWIRLLEGPAPEDLPIQVQNDPLVPIPDGFNLVKEFDTADQLADLTPDGLTVSFGGASGVLIQACSIDAAEECLFGVSSTGDPKLTTPGGLAIPVAIDQELIVEIGVITSADFGTTSTELFWNDASGGFGGPRRVAIPQLPADDMLHITRITWRNGAMATQLNQMRYDPAIAAEIDVEVDYIRVYTNAPLPTELAWDTDPGTADPQGGTGDWNTTNNFWNDGANNVSWPSVATGDDNAIFGGTAGTVTVDAGGITAHSLNFNVDGYTVDGGALTFDSSLSAPSIAVDGGTVTATVASVMDASDDDLRKSGTGSLLLQGATTANSLTAAGGTTTVAPGATLTTLGTNPTENGFAFKLTGSATLNINGTVDADEGDFGGFSGDANFTVNVNTGSNLIANNVRVGWNATATYNFNDGTTTAGGFLRHQDAGSGIINVFGGTHSFAGNLDAITNGNNSNSVFTISGGEFIANNVQMSPVTAGAGTGTNSYTINLDGGILETNRVSIRRGAGADAGGANTLNVLFNGGILRASPGSGSASLIDGDTGVEVSTSTVTYNATVEAGGAIIDTNGENKSVDQPLKSGTASGGSLTKQGMGALYLNQENEYDGDTVVTAGTLGGSGSVFGDVTINAGAGLAYFITDPSLPEGGLTIDNNLILPDPLVISIDSGDGPFVESSVTGLVVASVGNSINGNPATITLDTTSFGGFGEFSNPRIVGNEVLIDYTAGENPYLGFIASFFPGETDPLIIGPDADPDGDDASNINEFAFGGIPNVNDGGGPRSFGVNDVGGTDFFTLTIAVPAGATFTGDSGALMATIQGLDIAVEGSAGLTAFDAQVTEITPIIGGLPAVPDGYEYKTFQLNPDASAGLGFMRNSAVETP